jgi:hypothetical protein
MPFGKGHTKIGGRKKGTKNRKTVLLEEKGREALAEVLGPDAFDGDAHSLLIAIYKDRSHPIDLRLEAAKAAIRFEKPALAAVDTMGQSRTCIMQSQIIPSPRRNGTSSTSSIARPRTEGSRLAVDRPISKFIPVH